MTALASACSPAPATTSGNVHLVRRQRVLQHLTDAVDLVVAQVREHRERKHLVRSGLAHWQGPVRKTQVRSLPVARDRVMDRGLNAERAELALNARPVWHG